ncbi:MAG: hypothetical protein WBD75_01445 [Phycisphaerae bacterium]
MTTEERLANLEKGMARAKRRNCWLLAALGLALGALVLAGTFTPKTAGAQGGGAAVNEVRARRLVLEDDEGRERGALEMGAYGPRLRLLDAAGQDRARLAVIADDSGLSLADENGKFCALLRVSKEGRALGLADENGKPRVVLCVRKDGSVLSLEKGKEIWSAP